MKNENEIPKGFYCYDENGICPYWSLNEERPEQENGYCSFLEKGDWDLNKEPSISWIETRQPDGTMHREKFIYLKSAEELGLVPNSLLWDRCKECDVNEYTDDELLAEKYLDDSILEEFKEVG